ncbi:endonuclease/exonuclease/phosphatase family protein [Treponema medium]|uniref:endonuclease/exonuclease/phosphatase family protein n=1 Tax=Treponema medium TaxID=58231 RepID=UPI00197F4EE9|nr:endonuclease/exonuclease/phosphatase family protein [Treponema medium]QSH91339.1 endonuclease/exonuclease/phosphatase family protein [Treponema medium]
MKLKRLLFSLFTCIAAGVFFLQCTRCTPLTDTQFKEPITLVTYNTQTFFDAVEDGSEFKEYKGSKSRWTDQKYRARLERLKGTMFAAGEKLTGKKDRLPDIAVLQEVENSRVIEDFCKQLPSGENYPYAVCPPRSEKGAFTTVILSKYPIEQYFVHRLYTEQKNSLRPLTEAVLNTGSKDKPQLLTVFAAHWKSKTGSSDSAAVRAQQEAQLIKKIQEHREKNPHIPFVVCGDFNQTLEEFNQLNDFPVCWDIEGYRAECEEGTQPDGSYYFKNSWEKIDHIFYESSVNGSDVSETTSDTGSAYIEPLLFFVLYEPPLIEDGKPVRYNVLTGEGYSDHLPLGFRFEIRD